MSYHFGKISKANLETCHPDLQTIMNEVIKIVDISILCGLRTEAEQKAVYEKGYSQVQYPNSRHNRSIILDRDDLSDAVDVAPYPIDWDDRERFFYVAGIIMGTAKGLKAEGKISYDLRWGGDWDSDNDFDDNSFDDLPHFELVSEE